MKRSLSRAGRRATALIAAMAIAASSAPLPAEAQRGKLPLVRDAETEDLLRDYAQPIFKAAGIPSSQVEIILVNDKGFNAFVPDSRRMFINIGVVLDAETPGEVIGVIAHETGHIAGNHLTRLRQAVANAQIIGVIGALLGVGAIAAGTGAGSADLAGGGAGLATAGAGFAKRSLLSYQRGEEATADRAALTYLERTGQSAKGMLTTFSRFADQNLFSAKYADPYAISHPLPRERLNALETLAKKSRYYDTPAPASLQARHDLVRAKLLAFTSHPRSVERAYPRSDKSMAAQYARAVVAAQSRNGRAASKIIDGLLRQQPNNPYFYELKGQALLESGNPRAAIEPFRRAVSLRPREGQFLIWLGFAMVASDDPGLLPEAEKILKAGLQMDANSPIGYQQLAIAHSRQGETAEANLATAQGLMSSGDLRGAKQYASRAQKNLKRGSREWLQADDILSYKPPQLRR
ncbi:M48 family metalloprotease [Stappia sp. GBMRC 2046]|uniref:M48 family metalloprotease n=1 Tax=Stappia sediminis TaxID=2692190 RepID=A0A7X3LXR5_9HYPH|nr:M48 family metalloprotease [Stappia sediminis]MXN67076.1 M48 family metalloprotease [Stappia sediminis]